MKKDGSIEFETIKSHKNRLYFLCGFVCVVVLLIIFVVTRSHAKYRVTQSMPLVNGTINYSLPDLNIVGLYIDGEEATELDSSKKYVLDTTQSTCTYKDGTEIENLNISYDGETGKLTITPFTTKGTKCYLYFDEKRITNIEELIASKNLATRTDFSTTLTEDTTGTIYYADTSKGRTYYFAGNPTDNWVKFADFYWRIIRINEDGSLRLIYQGTNANTIGGETQVQKSLFNNSWNDNMYTGYMYWNNQVHGIVRGSTIKGKIDTWYQDNLSSYADKIDGNAGFCGDRTPSTSSSSSNGSGGTGTTTTYYGGYIRLYTNKQPTFDCSNKDLYTTSGSSQGNQALQYPTGLISMDEVWYAGGTFSNNIDYYLYTGQSYWTMTPAYFNVNAWGIIIDLNGNINFTSVDWTNGGIRPVINLKADIQITGGNGTSTNPYVIN